MQFQPQVDQTLAKIPLYQPLYEDLLALQDPSQFRFLNKGLMSVRMNDTLKIYRESDARHILSNVTSFYLPEIFKPYDKEAPIEVCLFERENLNDPVPKALYLILIGNNHIHIYKELAPKLSNFTHCIQKEATLGQFQIVKGVNKVYFLNNNAGLAIIDFSGPSPGIKLKELRQRRSIPFMSRKSQSLVQNDQFQAIIFQDRFIIAQKQDHNSISIILSQDQQFLVEKVHTNTYVDSHSSSILGFKLAVVHGKLFLYALVRIEYVNRENKQVFKLKVFANQVVITGSELGVGKLEDVTIEKLGDEAGQMSADFLIIQNTPCFLLRVNQVSNYFVILSENLEIIEVEGPIFQYGIVEYEDSPQVQVQILHKRQIKILKTFSLQKQEKPEKILPYKLCIHNQVLFTLFIERLQAMVEEEDDAGRQKDCNLLLELQAFNSDQIYGVVNHITSEILSQPLSKIEFVMPQLEQRKSKLEDWKFLIKRLKLPNTLLLNAAEAQIFLSIAIEIQKLESEELFSKAISECLQLWCINHTNKIQFYSQLQEIQTFFVKLLSVQNYQSRHALELLIQTYEFVMDERGGEMDNLHWAPFWTWDESWWRDVLDQCFSAYQKEPALEVLFKLICRDYRLLMDYQDSSEKLKGCKEVLIRLGSCTSTRPMLEERLSYEYLECYVNNLREHLLVACQEIQDQGDDGPLARVPEQMEEEGVENGAMQKSREDYRQEQVQDLDSLYEILERQDAYGWFFVEKLVESERGLIERNKHVSPINWVIDALLAYHPRMFESMHKYMERFPKLQFYFSVRAMNIEKARAHLKKEAMTSSGDPLHYYKDKIGLLR